MMPLTRQEMFDKAYIGVVKQGRKSSSNKGCLYLNPKTGDRCAVGHIFNDEELSACGDFLGGIEGLWEYKQHEITSFEWGDLGLLEGLQGAHDTWVDGYKADFVTYFKEKAAAVAKHYNLTIPEVV